MRTSPSGSAAPTVPGPTRSPARRAVRLVTWHLPEELNERHEGAPIDHDDLLDFHALLQQDDWLETLRGMTPG